jgi:hypothetical protein
MKLVIISLGLFFCMKMIYGFWGDYYNDYWSVVYYLVHYFMMVSVFRYMFFQASSVLQAQFFGLAFIYFSALFLLYIACLFKISLYKTLVSDVGYWGVGGLVLTIGILFIQYKLRKSHARKIRTKTFIRGD